MAPWRWQTIGSTLRETRIRRKIDLSEVEAATKIRARYLRAIENEEWEVLPGGAYVRAFIRTYANYLGLDGERLVDGVQRASARAGGPPSGRSLSERRGRSRAAGVASAPLALARRRRAVASASIVLLVGARPTGGGDEGSRRRHPAATPAAGAAAGHGKRPVRRGRAARPKAGRAC